MSIESVVDGVAVRQCLSRRANRLPTFHSRRLQPRNRQHGFQCELAPKPYAFRAFQSDLLAIRRRVSEQSLIALLDLGSFASSFSKRVRLPVQIATDNHRPYAFHIRQHFGYEGYNYGTETKIFGEPMLADGTLARLGRNEGVRKMQTAERKAVVGSPDLESLTTSHVERAFLTVRQELKRFERKGLGYSKNLEMHRLAVTLHFGVYNFVRHHHTLGTTPAVAAGLEEKPWSLERVVEMTEAHCLRKRFPFIGETI